MGRVLRVEAISEGTSPVKPDDLDTAIALCAQGKAFEAWGELTALKLRWNVERVGRKRPPSLATVLERTARKLRDGQRAKRKS